MAIPTHEEIMLPILKICEDGQEHTRKNLVLELSDLYKMTNEERQRRLPSGSMTYLYNRVGWAKLGLLKAGLLTSPLKVVHVEC